MGNGKLGEQSYQKEEKPKKEKEPSAAEHLSEPTEEDYRNAYRFTEEELREAWDDVARVLTGGKKSLYFTMINGELELDKENFLITITVRNDIQKEEVKQQHRKIVQVLRKKLNNKVLQLNVKVVYKQETAKPYTKKEKYEHLVKKNPELKKLTDRLGLDTEG